MLGILARAIIRPLSTQAESRQSDQCCSSTWTAVPLNPLLDAIMEPYLNNFPSSDKQDSRPEDEKNLGTSLAPRQPVARDERLHF